MDTFFTFTVNGDLLGIPADRVIEVSRETESVRIPGAPPFVMGLINLRGDLAVAIDMSARVSGNATKANRHLDSKEHHVCVFVRTDHAFLGLIVDELGQLFVTDQSPVAPPAHELEMTASHLIVGAYALKPKILLLLDPEKLLYDDTSATTDIELKTS